MSKGTPNFEKARSDLEKAYKIARKTFLLKQGGTEQIEAALDLLATSYLSARNKINAIEERYNTS